MKEGVPVCVKETDKEKAYHWKRKRKK